MSSPLGKLAGDKLPAGPNRFSTVLPDFDFETYSSAGYYIDDEGKRRPLIAKKEGGLSLVGARLYAEHHSTEVISLAYDLKDGLGARLWIPGADPPQDLFDHIENGGILEAWNSLFEYYIWKYVCEKKMGWPPLPIDQIRDAMAKAYSWGLPGALAKVGDILGAEDMKDSGGKRLIDKFSKPRSATKIKKYNRTTVQMEPVDANLFYLYNIQDIKAEASISAIIPDLSPKEERLFILDQKINVRGVKIDLDMVEKSIRIFEAERDFLNQKLFDLTGGKIPSADLVEQILNFVNSLGARMEDLTRDTIEEKLKYLKSLPFLNDNENKILQILEIRYSLSSSSVKKLYTMRVRANSEGRISDNFQYHGADTGRWAARGVQVQNLPNKGPKVKRCKCGKHYGLNKNICPWCFGDQFKIVEWGAEAALDCLQVFAYDRIDYARKVWDDPIKALSGSMRSFIISEENHDLICSDFSAIEAVVLSVLAGEQWRIEVFKTHGKIYEMSGSKISGIPFEEIMEHKKRTGDHHPIRKAGKISELALGYQGFLGAMRQMSKQMHIDLEKTIGSEDDIKATILKWRDENPMIVKFWKSVEKMVVDAIKYPGYVFEYNRILFGVFDKRLYIQLPSTRFLVYQSPITYKAPDNYGRIKDRIEYMGWNSMKNKWMTINLYGGKITENIVQAVSRDILGHSMLNIEAKGYPIIMHVHDEIISEVHESFGSVEEFESIMNTLPDWCADWPVKATGGWRDKRYKKD